MQGSSEFWRKCSHRSHAQADSIGESLVYMAGHCAQCARYSFGWVYVGDLMQKMKDDGISHATIAYAMHAFTMLPSGEIDVLGIRATDMMVLDETEMYHQWLSFLNTDASRDAV
eukprot:8368503-Pyramimonas_sp.AAC.1